jgi:hypothetical protein
LGKTSSVFAAALMPIKRLLCPQRLLRIPRQFSWIDQRYGA